MSIQATTLVWQRTRAKGSNLLMLLAIADYAKDDGRWAWPSATTLAWKARLTARAGRLILEKLVVDGEVWAEWDAKDTRLYLHLRCLCDWPAYQQEGPLPVAPPPEKFSAWQTEKFSVGLAQTAAARHEKCRGTSVALKTLSTSPESFSDPSRDPSPRAREARPPSLQAYVDVWNGTTTPPIPRCLTLTDKRRQWLRAVVHEYAPAQWADLCAKVEASRFCRGENDRGWVASLDWLIGRRDAAVKVREGQYDNRPTKTDRTRLTPSAQSTSAAILDACDHDPRCGSARLCQMRRDLDAMKEKQPA